MITLPNTDKALYGLIGHPLGHTLSPAIHNTAFQLLGLNALYLPFDVPPAGLAEAVAGLQAQGLRGLNVTVPHKEAIVPLVGHLDAEAALLGCVNTLAEEKGVWTGYNTDGKGFRASLHGHAGWQNWKRILVLGAGGGSRAVVCELLKNSAAEEITVAARDFLRGRRLASQLQGMRPRMPLRVVSLRTLPDEPFDLIVNATPVGLNAGDHSPVPPSTFKGNGLAYDLIYRPAETKFLAAARQEGWETMNGLAMLLGQAAEAFEIWTGRKMPIPDVRAHLDALFYA